MNAEVLILFATTTGNAEECSLQLERELKKAGIASRSGNAAEFSPQGLRGTGRVLIFASTWGDGDPPDDAIPFYEELEKFEPSSMEGTEFAVFALGDRSYDHFCAFGRKLDEHLERLGARRMLPRVECDVHFDTELEVWIPQVLAWLARECRTPDALAS